VTAGVRLNEPGADLAVAAALLSSMHDRPTPPRALFIGELGLGGEVRPISGLDRRLGEAARLGFAEAFGSARSSARIAGMHHRGLEHVEELVRALAA
jgi:DNA repair protein RadA/Sms